MLKCPYSETISAVLLIWKIKKIQFQTSRTRTESLVIIFSLKFQFNEQKKKAIIRMCFQASYLFQHTVFFWQRWRHVRKYNKKAVVWSSNLTKGSPMSPSNLDRTIPKIVMPPADNYTMTNHVCNKKVILFYQVIKWPSNEQKYIFITIYSLTRKNTGLLSSWPFKFLLQYFYTCFLKLILLWN